MAAVPAGSAPSDATRSSVSCRTANVPARLRHPVSGSLTAFTSRSLRLWTLAVTSSTQPVTPVTVPWSSRSGRTLTEQCLVLPSSKTDAYHDVDVRSICTCPQGSLQAGPVFGLDPAQLVGQSRAERGTEQLAEPPVGEQARSHRGPHGKAPREPSPSIGREAARGRATHRPSPSPRRRPTSGRARHHPSRQRRAAGWSPPARPTSRRGGGGAGGRAGSARRSRASPARSRCQGHGRRDERTRACGDRRSRLLASRGSPTAPGRPT